MLQYTLRLKRSGKRGTVYVARDDIEMRLATWRGALLLEFQSSKETPFLDKDDRRNICQAFMSMQDHEVRDFGAFSVALEADPDADIRHYLLSVNNKSIGSWISNRGLRLNKTAHPIFNRDRKRIALECKNRGQSTNLGIFGSHDAHEMDGVIESSAKLDRALKQRD